MSNFLSQAKPAETYRLEESTYKIKAILLGDSGTGKTTSAMTLPGKKLLIDLDGRSESIASRTDVDILKIFDEDPRSPHAMEDLIELGNEIWEATTNKTFVYDSIILDGLTFLTKIAMNWALQLTGSQGKKVPKGLGDGPAQAHYLPQMNSLSNYILRMLPLPVHFCLTGHLDIFQDELLQTISVYPKTNGKVRTEITSWFNETYVCEKTKDGYFWLTDGTHRQSFLKSSLNELGNFWKSPIEVDFTKPKVGFQELLEYRFKKPQEKGGENKKSKPSFLTNRKEK